MAQKIIGREQEIKEIEALLPSKQACVCYCLWQKTSGKDISG